MRMRSSKGQSDIIAVILIVLIAIGLLSVAYTFGIPLINKSQDEALSGRVDSFFLQSNINSLPSKVEAVANSGGRDTAVLDVSGVTRVFGGDFVGEENNSIDFSFQSSVSSKNPDGKWISVTPGGCPPQKGVLGLDEPAVICAKSDRAGDGKYNLTYKVYFRELEDAERKNGFKINLIKHPSSPATSAGSALSARIEFDGRRQVVDGPKNLIITDVKVLLV